MGEYKMTTTLFAVSFKNDMWPYDYSETTLNVLGIDEEDAKEQVMKQDPYCTITKVERK
jgi:hypothetical protein